MNELLLSSIWKHQLFDTKNLKTSQGEEVLILQPGKLNSNQGPDFSMAKIKIAGTLWVGNVEIHVNTGDWDLHLHQNDPRYKNVILHVVFNNDKPCRSNAPILELRPLLTNAHLLIAENLIKAKTKIACGTLFADYPHDLMEQWLEKLLLLRLKRKSELIKSSYLKNESQNIRFLRSYCATLGFKKNSHFEWLATALDFNLIATLQKDEIAIEAYLFGMAGMLAGEANDSYQLLLMNKFAELASKYQLTIEALHWNYLRMRPSNFPELRLAQLNAVLVNWNFKNQVLLSLSELETFLYSVTLNQYWQSHYRFGLQSENKHSKLSKDTIDSILINAYWPLVFLYENDDAKAIFQNYKAVLQSLKAENNSIVSEYRKLGFNSSSAIHSQALLELNAEYCLKKKCLHCEIGCYSLNQSGSPMEIAI